MWPQDYGMLGILVHSHSKDFVTLLNDYSLFFKRIRVLIVIVATYNDVILIIRDTYAEKKDLNSFLHSEFKIKNLRSPHFLVMDVLKDDHSLIISQRKYTSTFLLEFDISHLPHESSPIARNIKFVVA